ncbi:MAG TPA: PKD domain-containing protein, partial [Myxococcaceae bacterium]|nr:PKD domain-containing protein [Myxococcaceae bacterium]
PPVALEFSRWRPRPDGEGWQSELAVQSPAGSDVTWERLERYLLRWDDTFSVRTLDWREVIRVDEQLPRGGFRGQVMVSPAESTTEIKQIVDKLYGRDAQGEEVVVSWTPYKAEAPPVPPKPVAEMPPRK